MNNLSLKNKLALLRELAEELDTTSTCLFWDDCIEGVDTKVTNGEVAKIIKEICHLAQLGDEFLKDSTSEITTDKVYKVYSGKAHHCACGCSGIYRIASAHREFADKDRGYPYEDCDVNDQFVAKVVGIIKNNSSQVRVFSGGSAIAVDVHDRTYVAYVVPQTKA